jgi:nucleotide-binding universal stress UspA family protein
MKSVIAAIDNSAAARPVLIAATALARVLGAGTQALHVSDDDGETAQGCAESLAIPFRRLRGEPFEQIVEQVKTPGVVAVAIGTRGRVREHAVGHLALAVASAIDKPVLVVPPEAVLTERFHSVLIAMEGTPRKSRAISAAVELAVDADLELVVVHVDDASSIPAFSDQLAHETDAYASEFLARYLPGAPRARLELRVGSPADEIIAASDSISAQLIAVGRPQSVQTSHGVTREVLERSRVPVLLLGLDERPVASEPVH